MKFTRLEIPDIVLIEPSVFGDKRGFFYESFRADRFAENGISARFVQDNHSRSGKGVLRGLHFQKPPKAQGKLVRVVKGSVYDVAVDIRKESKTFGRYVGIVLSEENRRIMYVPPGFAHGFCVLEDDTEFLYKVTDVYSPQDEGGVIWNDPDLGIPWPEVGMDYVFSEKDKHYPRLKDLDSPF